MKKRRSIADAGAAIAAAVIFFLTNTVLPPAIAGIVENTFLVSQVNMTHLCKETLVTVVNGQLPGPVINVTEGDSVVVHVVNKSPYNMTIHWHGVKQRLNCWADGVPLITQYPILPNQNFTYRFDVSGQEGTLWWHAHIPCLRATVHGAIVIRPRHGPSMYPFTKPHREIPIIIGEWWEVNLEELDMDLRYFVNDHFFSASTINGKLGDLYNCSGVVEDGFVLDIEPGRTYLLRVINAALYSEYYFKIAGHKFTVVAAGANYVKPYTTDVIAIAPGETIDALVVTDAPPGSYYMVALPSQPPKPDFQSPVLVARGTVKYADNHNPRNGTVALSSYHGQGGRGSPAGDVPVAPEMPDNHDASTSFYFHGNLRSLQQRLPAVPAQVDDRIFITLGLGSVCRRGKSCKRGEGNEEEFMLVATMNNVSFELPAAMTPLLEAQYYHGSSVETLHELPDRPPRVYNFTDPALIPYGPKAAQLEMTSSKTMVARRFRYGTTVELVFQGTALMQAESNPMHLHGHDMYVLAQGFGNYEAERDMAKYNLVDPPMVNTVLVPRLGWVAVRFIADNPGVWFMHCHFEFHLSMGMAAVFIVEDGPTVDTSLPPPPVDFPTCGHADNPTPDECYLKTKKSESSRVNVF
ncbi:laccase-15-like [Panicum miliaceum]|uniref:Laccase n=1 Tax=Panicum miliaceum TaxID=4540 RepID=A0A3L6PLJ9_PANMI|nr:laccase-15-like [Panicum miliaceum]